MWKLKIEFFKTREKALERKAEVGGDIDYYLGNGKTREDYIVLLETKEKYFDEYFAEQFPYVLSYIEG